MDATSPDKLRQQAKELRALALRLEHCADKYERELQIHFVLAGNLPDALKTVVVAQLRKDAS